jgi:hypothetical protein
MGVFLVDGIILRLRSHYHFEDRKQKAVTKPIRKQPRYLNVVKKKLEKSTSS